MPDATEKLVLEALERQQTLRKNDPTSSVVLVVAGVVTSKGTEVASESGLTIWDRDALLRRAPPSIVELYRAARRRESAHDLGAELLATLADIPSGGAPHWVEYQDHVGRLIEYLFVFSLGVP